MKLSIVTTLYKSDQYVTDFYQRATVAAKELAGDDYEIIFVNDGSPDNSLELAAKLTEHDTHIVVIDLSRNFGHHKAMMTGLAHTKGEYIFLIDSDLEECPEWLLAFAKQMEQKRCDVVYGVQEKRKGNWFERWSGEAFWRLINFLSGLMLPANMVTARLMSRRYVDELIKHEEHELFMAGIWMSTGFEQEGHFVRKLNTSSSTYTFQKKVSLFVNSVTSFSNLPLIGIFYAGLIIFVFSGLYTLYLIINWLFFSLPVSGWTSVMASIWLLGGLVISFMGLIGIYLSKIFLETKRRPYTIIRNIYGRS